MMSAILQEESSDTKLEISPLIHPNSDAIRDVLQRTPNPRVKSLELIGLPIDRTIAALVSDLLRQRDWDYVSLVGCTGRDLFTLFFGLTRVHTLNLTGLTMTHEDCCALGMALKATTTTTTPGRALSFTWCSLQSGIFALSEGLANNITLEELTMAGCHLSDQHLGQLLSNLNGVKKLNIEDNHMHTLGSRAIAQLLRRNQIVQLNLSQQSIPRNQELPIFTKVQTWEIAEALRVKNSLRALDLSNNQLEDEDLFCLAEALVSNTTLHILDVGSNNFTNAGIEGLSLCLQHMRGLKDLSLVHNPFDSADTLLKALKINTELETLRLDRYIPEYTGIQYYLSLNRGGRRLLMQSRVPLGLWPLVLERCQGLKWNHDVIFHFVQERPELFGRIIDGPCFLSNDNAPGRRLTWSRLWRKILPVIFCATHPFNRPR